MILLYLFTLANTVLLTATFCMQFENHVHLYQEVSLIYPLLLILLYLPLALLAQRWADPLAIGCYSICLCAGVFLASWTTGHGIDIQAYSQQSFQHVQAHLSPNALP